MNIIWSLNHRTARNMEEYFFPEKRIRILKTYHTRDKHINMFQTMKSRSGSFFFVPYVDWDAFVYSIYPILK